MKNTILLAVLYILLFSCKGNEIQTTEAQDSIEWNLISLQSGLKAGESQQLLPYNESYMFKSDSTFLKLREDNGKRLQGTGTYKTTTTSDGKRYNLTYKSQNPIVGSCTGNKTEELLLRPDGKLQNSWMMCDGPYKVYKVVGSR